MYEQMSYIKKCKMFVKKKNLLQLKVPSKPKVAKRKRGMTPANNNMQTKLFHIHVKLSSFLSLIQPSESPKLFIYTVFLYQFK